MYYGAIGVDPTMSLTRMSSATDCGREPGTGMTEIQHPLPPTLRVKLGSPGTGVVCPQSEGPYPTLHILERCISRKTWGLHKSGEERVEQPIKIKTRKWKERKQKHSRGGADEDKVNQCYLCVGSCVLCLCQLT